MEKAQETTIFLTSEDPERAMESILFAIHSAVFGQKVSLFFALGGLVFLRNHQIFSNDHTKDIFQLVDQARSLGVAIYACSLNLDKQGMDADQLAAGIEMVGVTTYLTMAEEATINLHW